MQTTPLYSLLQKYSHTFHPIVNFSTPNDKLLQLDFTASNNRLTSEILADTNLFSQFLEDTLGKKYRYGIGGYAEHRIIYARSTRYDGDEEPRRLHLAIDIWGPAGTPVFTPLDGFVHSFAFNNSYGDYGATIILKHELEGITFHTLYGHLSVKDLIHLEENKLIKQGTEIGHFGVPEENGYWPPHLHFQVINEMQGYKGDYMGVCKYSEREKYLLNCPDPDLILNMMQYSGANML